MLKLMTLLDQLRLSFQENQSSSWSIKTCLGNKGRKPVEAPALLNIFPKFALVFASIAAVNAYTYYQNGKIEKLDCRFGEDVNVNFMR